VAERGVLTADAVVGAPPSQIYPLLCDLDQHRHLTDDGMRILRLEGEEGRRTGGLVELRGPMGIKRLVRTSVSGAEPGKRLWGTALTEQGAKAHVDWRLQPRHGERTTVEVRIEVQAARWPERLLLALGGRTWLRARMRAALRRMGERV
jgi:uncharacterized protein YndB with AHSA1/START domain